MQMKPLVKIIFLGMLSLSFYAQVQISGKVLSSSDNLPLESATVYLTTEKDSTLLSYASSEKNGSFLLKVKKNSPKSVLKISYLGHKTFKKVLENFSENILLGNLVLEEQDDQLKEVVITADVPPVKFKKDTLEFDAKSFKVGPDANVDQLLRQLPGVEIDEEGKITVNGREVNNVFVNGKPLFGSDGKIVTQNLPADMINKVQVTTTKSRKEQMSGDVASGSEATINLTIDEDKNKGLMGRVTAGFGTDDRYESSLLVNTFKGDRRLSVLASSNNINSVGFSQDEVFDNMGGGRNRSMYYNSDGSFGINGMRFGGNTGITTTNLLGLNYGDEWLKKKISPNLTMNYTNVNTVNENKTNRTSFLPTGTTNTLSESKSVNESKNFIFNQDYYIKIDSTFSISVTPRLTLNETISDRSFESITQNEQNELLNTNDNRSFSINNTNRFSNDLNVFKQFKKKGRYIDFEHNLSVDDNQNNQTLNSETVFVSSGAPSDLRNQNVINTNKVMSQSLDLTYITPISDSLSLGFHVLYSVKQNKEQLNTFDANGLDFSLFNEILSNLYESLDERLSGALSYRIRKKKFNATVGLGVEKIYNQNQGVYLGQTFEENRQHWFPKFRMNVYRPISDSKSIYANVDYTVDLPSAMQLLNIENFSNPLNTTIGNLNLKPTESLDVYLGYNNYQYVTRTGIYFYGGGRISKNNIVSFTNYDDDFKATSSFENIDLNYNFWLGTNWSKGFSHEKSKFRLSLGISASHDYNQGFINDVLFQSRGYRINPRFNGSWSIDKLLEVSPSYQVTFNKSNYTNYIIESISNEFHKANVQTTFYMLKNFIFGNDISYNYNSNIADGFRKDFYLWNMSLGYEFYQKKMIAKVKVYDLLNQNLNNSRQITPTAVVDSENLILQRYAMFSLTYKFDKYGKNKAAEAETSEEEETE